MRVKVKVYVIINQVSIEAGGDHTTRLREVESELLRPTATIKICIRIFNFNFKNDRQ